MSELLLMTELPVNVRTVNVGNAERGPWARYFNTLGIKQEHKGSIGRLTFNTGTRSGVF